MRGSSEIRVGQSTAHTPKESGHSSPRNLLSAFADGQQDASLIFEQHYSVGVRHMLNRLLLPKALVDSVSKQVAQSLFDRRSPFNLGRYTGTESFVRYLRRAIVDIVMAELRQQDASSITSDLAPGLEVEGHRKAQELETQIRDRLPMAFADGWAQLSDEVRERLCRTAPSKVLNPDQARWASQTRKALLQHQPLDAEAAALALFVVEKRLYGALVALHQGTSGVSEA